MFYWCNFEIIYGHKSVIATIKPGCVFSEKIRRVSTLIQPNFGVFGIDLSAGGCWELPMCNRYSHPSSKRMWFLQVQIAFQPWFQLRFSYVSAHLIFIFLQVFFGPKTPTFLKVKLWVKEFFCVFQLCFSWQKRGAHPLKILLNLVHPHPPSTSFYFRMNRWLSSKNELWF